MSTPGQWDQQPNRQPAPQQYPPQQPYPQQQPYPAAQPYGQPRQQYPAQQPYGARPAGAQSGYPQARGVAGYAQPASVQQGPPAGYGPRPGAPAWGTAPRKVRQRNAVVQILLIIVAATAMLAVIGLMSRSAANGGGAPALPAILLAGLSLAAVGCVVFWADRWEREPWLTLLLAFVWGGGVAVWIAMFLNEPVGMAINDALGYVVSHDAAPAVFGAPWVEEALKSGGVLVIALLARRQMNGPIDGFVYGAVIAGGFAFTENIQYLIFMAGENQFQLWFVRGVLGPFGHIVYTAPCALAIGWAVTSRNKLTWLAVPLGYLLGVGMHGLWNSGLWADTVGIWGGFALIQWVPMLALLVVIAALQRRDGRLITKRLSEYVPAGWLSAGEVDMLGSLSGRTRARQWAARGGPIAVHAMRDFQTTATKLAFGRDQVHVRGQDARGAQDELAWLGEMSRARAAVFARMPG